MAEHPPPRKPLFRRHRESGVAEGLVELSHHATALSRSALRLPAHALRLVVPSPRRRVGAIPGTLPDIPHEERTPARLSVFHYDGDRLAEHAGVSPEEALLVRGLPGTAWIDVIGVRDPDAIAALGEAFGLHPLVQEDLVNTHQRPKMEAYAAAEGHPEQLFIVVKMLHAPAGPRTDVRVEQVGFVLGPGYLLTFQEIEGDVFDPVRERLRQHVGRLRRAGADYLAYALLDVIVDHYFVVIEALGEQIEALEEAVLARPRPEHQERLRALRRDALFLRRAAWPLREVLGALLREDSGLVEDRTKVYLRDAYDHAVQVMDSVEGFRETLASLNDLYLTSISLRMNEVMKVLTVVGTVFIPLSFFAGIYGMNFEYIPELEWRYGYFAFLGMTALILVGSFVFFRRKGWL